jgi:RND family efflux transporter MFP subunit
VKRKVVILLIALTGACGQTDPEPAQSAYERTTPVIGEQPVQRDIDYVLTALGSVESINDPTVSAQAAGQVQEIAVEEGDTVETGQLLAALDSTLHSIETAKAEAEVRRSGVLLENQQNEVNRLQRLDESQSVSRDKLEDEQAQLEMLKAQRDVARKQWEQARYMESKTHIVAPITGMVARRHISPGDYVSNGQPLFDLVRVDLLRARVAFPEHAASKIKVGKVVQLTTPAAPGIVAIGEVAAVNPQIKTHNRAVEITVEFDNPGGWLPGASTDATLVVERHNEALTVPLLAVVNRSGRDVIFVIENGQARAVPIEAGWREQGWVEVLDGISATDIVVVEGAGLISHGSKVELKSPPQ